MKHMMKISLPVISTIMTITAFVAPLQAETIIIGKGVGIVWEGLPFSKTLYGPIRSSYLNPIYGLLSVSSLNGACMLSSQLENIGGYMAYPLPGVSGVGLIPRASGRVSYRYYENFNQNKQKDGILTGTIGLPQTIGNSSSQNNITPVTERAWCLPPGTTSSNTFYVADSPRSATLSGTWVLVADGTQQPAQVKLPPMYFGSYGGNADGSSDRVDTIFPGTIDLRISTLECTVNTPTTIDFGAVNRNSQVNAELALKSVPLVTTCGQASDYINANINIQFRAISGLYNSDASKLKLTQGGGYITGEIDSGMTGSGACGTSTGLRFDNIPIKLGSITNVESSKILTNQLTWRLCSGGSSLPTGAVNASAEMLVTFN